MRLPRVGSRKNPPAILNVWYGGQDAGNAIADVLFGDYNPSGKLPVTFYAKDSDLPPFNSYEMKNRTYRYFDGEVLYPFGYGLSYTTFNYELVSNSQTVKSNGTVSIDVMVRNTGKRAGEDVVQLYVSNSDYDGQKPLYALKAFERISLKAGESHQVKFNLSPEQFAIVDAAGIPKVTPGKHKLYIGSTSPTRTKAQRLPLLEQELVITK